MALSPRVARERLAMMEINARGEEDHHCNKRYNGSWLEVIAEDDGTYRYKWGTVYVEKPIALNVIMTFGG